MLNFNIVTGCGDNGKTIVRYNDTYYAGSVKASYEEIIETIKNDASGYIMEECVNKVNEVSQEVKEVPHEVVMASGTFPIELAAGQGWLDMVQYLVSQGVDLHFDDDCLIVMAAANSHLSVVDYFITKGLNVNTHNGHAIRFASYNGDLEMVKFLVDHGVDVQVDDNAALKWAKERGHKDVVKYLLSKGAYL